MRYRTITITIYDCNGEIIFVSDKIRAKMPQKPIFESKEIPNAGHFFARRQTNIRKQRLISWKTKEI